MHVGHFVAIVTEEVVVITKVRSGWLLAVAGALGVAVCLGCGSARVYESRLDASFRIPRDAPIYVMRAADGGHRGRTERGSGLAASREVTTALSYQNPLVELAESSEPRTEVLALAQSRGFAFVVDPEVVLWENRATNWSGRPDRVRIVIRLFDATDGRALDATTISATGPSLLDLGGPAELLRKPLIEYAENLF